MKTWITAGCLGIVILSGSSGLTSDRSRAIPQDAAGRSDPAVIRRNMLVRLDARIDAQATQAHLDARLTLDEVMPIPYLGVDLETVDGGARITGVYPETGAAAAGLKVGDVIRSLGGVAVDSKPAVGRTLRTHRIGETIPIVVVRGRETLTIPATPGPRPEEDEDEEEQFPDLPPRVVLSTAPFSLAADGDLASHIDAVVGGHGRPSRWVVLKDDGHAAIRQEEADRTGIRFPMAIVRGFVAGDVVASARFRYFSGVVDKAAGLVIRYQDPGNYIVARANAGESDLRIFRVASGMRRTLPGAIVKCRTDDDRWHTIELRAQGPLLTATVDGGSTTTGYDSFFLSGGVGLWTKSDAVTDFDAVKFDPLPAAASRPAQPR